MAGEVCVIYCPWRWVYAHCRLIITETEDEHWYLLRYRLREDLLANRVPLPLPSSNRLLSSLLIRLTGDVKKTAVRRRPHPDLFRVTVYKCSNVTESRYIAHLQRCSSGSPMRCVRMHYRDCRQVYNHVRSNPGKLNTADQRVFSTTVQCSADGVLVQC